MKKPKILFAIVAFCLCIMAVSIGAYAARNLQLNVNGNLGYSKHQALVSITGSINNINVNNTLSSKSVSLMVESVDGVQITESTVTFDSLSFYQDSSNVKDIEFDLSFQNFDTENDLFMEIEYPDALSDGVSVSTNSEYVNVPYNGILSKGGTVSIKFGLSATSALSLTNFKIKFRFHPTSFLNSAYLANDWKDKLSSTFGANSTNITSVDFVNDLSSYNHSTFVGFNATTGESTSVSIGAENENLNVPETLSSSVTDVKAYAINTNDTYKIVVYTPAVMYAGACCEGMFSDFKTLSSVKLENFNTSKATTMKNMFNLCNVLNSLDLSNFDTQNVTNMERMFYCCTRLNELKLSSKFTTTNVTTMKWMFAGLYQLQNLDVSSITTSAVTNVTGMFLGCRALTSLDLSNFDLSNVTNSSYVGNMLNFESPNKIELLKTPKNAPADLPITTDSTLYYDGEVVTSVPAGLSESRTYTTEVPANAIFPTTWKTEIEKFENSVSSDDGYVSLTIFAMDLTKIAFEKSAPTGYQLFGTLSTGIKVYQNPDIATDIAFVWAGTIEAPEDSSLLFGTEDENTPMQLTSITFNNFNTSNSIDFAGMFSYCTSIVNLNLTSFDTSKVNSMQGMFNYCTSLESVNLSSFNTSLVQTMSGMFQKCEKLTALSLSHFDTINVTTMVCMFNFCLSLETLNVSSFNTSKVTDMRAMFQRCDKITTLNVSSFDTSKVTNMEHMFAGCFALTNINLSNFNTENVQYIKNMFYACEALQTITFSSKFSIQKASDLRYMFESCKALTNLNLSHFNTSNVTDMSYMFRNCEALQTITFSSSFTTANVTNMKSMFQCCYVLESIDVSSFNTKKVTDMNAMFAQCKKLKSIDLSNFNSPLVTDIAGMFNDCLELTTANMSGFNTSSVVDMGWLFGNCPKLESADLSSFNTVNCEVMNNMFYDCSSLKTLDLSSFDMTKVTGYSNMLNFGSSNQIEILKTPKNASAALPITTGSTLYDLETGSALSTKQVPAGLTSSKTYVNAVPKSFPTTWKTEVASTSYMTTTLTPTTLTKIAFEKTAPSGYSQIGTLSSGIKVYKNSSVATDIAFVSDAVIKAPTNSSYLFNGLTNLTSISFNNFNTSLTAQMNDMFTSNSKMTSITFGTDFTTENATTFAGMFNGCTALTSLDLSKFSTPKVIYMSHMFYDCEALQTITFSSAYTTANVTTMQSMFQHCYALESVDVSSFNTEKVQNMNAMFGDCHSLVNLDLSSFNNAACTNFGGIFWYCYGLKTLTLSSNFVTSKATTVGSMFNNCRALEKLDCSGFDLSGATDYSNIFLFGDSNQITEFKTPKNAPAALPITTGSTLYDLETGNEVTSVPANLTVSKIYASTVSKSFPNTWKTEVANSTYMTVNGTTTTLNPTNLTKISFETTVPEGYNLIGGLSSGLPVYQNSSTPTEIAFVWAGTIEAPESCEGLFGQLDTSEMNLTSIAFHNFDTSNVTSMKKMFRRCSSLTSLDLSDFDTSKVTDMNTMFGYCENLTSLNVTSFDTSSVETFLDMFYSCKRIKTINLSNFVTTSAVNFGEMFAECNAIEILNISNFDMTNATYIEGMLNFGSSNAIKIILTPKKTVSAIPITTSETLYKKGEDTILTEIPAGLTSSIEIINQELHDNPDSQDWESGTTIVW